MVPLSADRHLEALIDQSAQFAEALRDADLQRQVPTCPQWSLYRLTEHVGKAHRWATAIVAHGVIAPASPRELDSVQASDDPEQLGQWLRGGAGELPTRSVRPVRRLPCGAGWAPSLRGSGLAG